MTNEEPLNKIKASIKKRLAFLKGLVEVAAEKYFQRVKAIFLSTLEHPTAKDAFIAGAEWVLGQYDENLSEKITTAYQLGLADKEKQTLKEAVEGWIAVDSDTVGKRRVTLFLQKPVRDVLTEYKYWAATRPRYESIKLDSNAFPNLKWEDEPKKVKIIIVKED